MNRRFLGGSALVAVLLAASIAWVWAGLPPRAEIRALARERPGETALMRQRREEAREKAGRPRLSHAWVPLSGVSRHLLHAVIASEDQRFLGHEGVDWEAIRQSFERNVERRRATHGGSTITQQLAKNLFFGTSRTVARKLRELVVARWLEEDLTKRRILELYLNVIEWGDGIYGCEAAAQYWYDKPAAALGRAEAAGLAAMIPNPRRINPRANTSWHARATERVLSLMERADYIGRDVARLGADPPPEVTEEEPSETPVAGEAPGGGSGREAPEPEPTPSPE